MKLAALAGLFATGCAYFTVPAVTTRLDAPPAERQLAANQCRDDKKPGAADLTIGSVLLLGGVTTVAIAAGGRTCTTDLSGNKECTQHDGTSTGERTAIWIGSIIGVLGLAQVISGGIGISRASDCQDIRASLATGPLWAPPAPPAPVIAPPGTERGACRPDGSCDPGLTCASSYCVRL